ncbi:MAG: diguanylate cyclase [Chitinivibrionales bacterium]|nr:diguanylate cyclase [Chitinivibrionales bacterium]
MNQKINTRYRILEELGRGGMGTVYLVEDAVFNHRRIALKSINTAMVRPEYLTIFKAEFLAMTRLKHPSLVQVYDFGVDKEDGTCFITMEYVQGKTLAQLIGDAGSCVSVETATDWIVALCRALEFIHSRNILHRDIKPANIILNGSEVKIMDFGLADLGERCSSRKGTPMYMAPEILSGKSSCRSDIYSLGVTLFEVFTKDKAFFKKLPNSIITYLTNKQEFLVFQEKMVEEIEDQRIQNIIRKMVQFEPENRYESAAEIIRDINREFTSHYPFETEATQTSYVLGARFVGRESEYLFLQEFLKNGEKAVLHICGEAGIGKSRLMNEMRMHCQLHEITFIEASCHETSEKSYGSFVSILHEAFFLCSDELLRKFGPELKKLLPDHEKLLQCQVAIVSDPKTERRTLSKNISDFLLDFARSSGTMVLLYINDVQWIDETSLELLENLVYKIHRRSANSGNSLKIITSGRKEASQRMKSVCNRPMVDRMELNPFDRTKVESFCASVFGAGKIGPQLMRSFDLIGTRVGGNPFFLQEVIASLVSTAAIVRQPQFWELIIPAETIDISRGIGDLLLKRYRRCTLTDKQIRTLEIMSLLDRKVSFEELNTINEIEFAELQMLHYYEIIKEELIEETLYFRIYHDLLRDVIVQGIQDKLELHLFIATKLEIIHKDNTESYIDELAYHYFQSRLKDKAITYMELAVENSLKKFEMVRTVDLCTKLLTLYDHDDRRKIGILLKQVDASRTFSNGDIMNTASHELYRLCTIHADVSSRARCNLLMGEIYLNLRQSAECIEYLEKSLLDYRAIGDKKGIASALNYIGVNYTFQDDNVKAMEFHKQSLEIADMIDDDTIRAFNIGNLGLIYENSGDYQEALSAYKKAVEILTRLDNKHNVSVAVHNAGLIYEILGDHVTALHYIDRAIVISEEIESYMYSALFQLEKAEILLKTGLLDQAQTFNEEAAAFFNELKIGRENIFRTRVLTAKIEYCRNNREKAVNMLTQVLDEFKEDTFAAKCYYELWVMTNEESKRTASLHLYHKLYSNTSRYEYKTYINKLEAAQTVGISADATSGDSGATTPDLEILKHTVDGVENIIKNNSLGLQCNLKETNIYLHKKLSDISNRFENSNTPAASSSSVEYEQKRIRFFQQLLMILHDLNSNLSVDTLLDKILDASISLLDAERGFILLLNNDNVLEIVAGRNKNKEDILSKDSRICQTVVQKVFDSQTALFIPDIADEEAISKCVSVVELELRSVMCASLDRRHIGRAWERRRYPFLTSSQKVGIIYLDNTKSTAESNFIDTNLNLFQALVDQASIALFNAMLYESANIDKLTGLYLRSFFDVSCEHELAFCTANKSHLSIVMIDIDFFKLVNDRFGHQTGDEVLKQLGALLKTTLRTSDICGRYGGEEFVVILTNTDLEQAELVAQKILKNVAANRFSSGTLTVSIGISAFPEHEGSYRKDETRKTLFKYADQALYYAKGRGRNRYELWSDEMTRDTTLHASVKDILTGDPIRDYRNVEMLLEVIKTISSTPARQEQLRRVIDLIIASFDASKGIILLFNETMDRLEVLAARDGRGEIDTGIHHFSRKIVETVFFTGKEVCMNAIEEEFETQSIREMEVKSVMCVPLYHHDKREGVIYIDSKKAIKQFTTTELYFLNAIASQVSLLLQLVDKM